jgi:antitoxin component YwqK of YwqJK toxin-antitoxin module
MYEGEYLNGEKNGQAKEYDNSGKLVFEGQYLEGKKLN